MNCQNRYNLYLYVIIVALRYTKATYAGIFWQFGSKRYQ